MNCGVFAELKRGDFMEFLGFIRPDGSVGVRNYVLIISSDPGMNGLCNNVAGTLINTLSVPSWPENGSWTEYIKALVTNPNVAGAVVVEPDREGPGEFIINTLAQTGKPSDIVTVSSSGGIIEASARVIRSAMLMVREASTMRRQATPISRLVTGLMYEDKSGTGDLLYHSVKLLVENNGRVVLSKKVADKKDKINGLHAVKKLPAGGKIDKNQGVYEIDHFENHHKTLFEMVSLGVQLVVAAGGNPCPLSHTILPVINITAEKDYFEALKDGVEVNLSGLNYESYGAEDYSLLIVNEIIATASGKLTKAEILKV